MEIINVHIVDNGKILKNSFLRSKNGIIETIGRMEQYVHADKDVHAGEDVLDGQFAYLCPGFIDIHNHGAKGFDAMDGTKEALTKISEFHLENGVTSFLATTMTGPLYKVSKLCDVLRANIDTKADILGIHMEGPFLSIKNKGAQPEKYLLVPEEENIRLLESMHPFIRLITVSPDVKNIEKLLEYCEKNEIVVSGGHDASIDEEVYAAIEHGMKSVTHLYCCSSTISRRENEKKHIGLTEIGLEDERLYAEVIADGHHIPDVLFRLIYKCKGYRKICLVSDAIRAAGMGEGKFFLGDGEHGVLVAVKNGIAVLEKEKVYAGSITPICEMVENLVKNIKIPIEEACYMASSSQTDLLSLKDRGYIRKGLAADLNLLSEEGHLLKTIKGEIQYEKV